MSPRIAAATYTAAAGKSPGWAALYARVASTARPAAS